MPDEIFAAEQLGVVVVGPNVPRTGPEDFRRPERPPDLRIAWSGRRDSNPRAPPRQERRLQAASILSLLIGENSVEGTRGRPVQIRSKARVRGMSGVLLTLPLVGDPNNLGGQGGWIDPVLLVLVLPSVGAALFATPWRRRRSAEGWRPRFLDLLQSLLSPLLGTASIRHSCSGTRPHQPPTRTTTDTGGSWQSWPSWWSCRSRPRPCRAWAGGWALGSPRWPPWR